MIRRATALLLLLGLAARQGQPSRAMPVIVQVQADATNPPAIGISMEGNAGTACQGRGRFRAHGAGPAVVCRDARGSAPGGPGRRSGGGSTGGPGSAAGRPSAAPDTGSTSAGHQPCAPCR